MDQIYKISFQINNTSFSIESTDNEWLEKKEKEYLSKIQETKKSTWSSEKTSEVLSDTTTINEFYRKYIKEKNVKSRTNLAVFFVYYLTKVKTLDSIRTSDVAQCFADISYPNYSKINVTDTLNQAKRRALLNCVNSMWSLTITGEDYVLNFLNTSDDK